MNFWDHFLKIFPRTGNPYFSIRVGGSISIFGVWDFIKATIVGVYEEQLLKKSIFRV